MGRVDALGAFRHGERVKAEEVGNDVLPVGAVRVCIKQAQINCRMGAIVIGDGRRIRRCIKEDLGHGGLRFFMARTSGFKPATGWVGRAWNGIT